MTCSSIKGHYGVSRGILNIILIKNKSGYFTTDGQSQKFHKLLLEYKNIITFTALSSSLELCSYLINDDVQTTIPIVNNLSFGNFNFGSFKCAKCVLKTVNKIRKMACAGKIIGFSDFGKKLSIERN